MTFWLIIERDSMGFSYAIGDDGERVYSKRVAAWSEGLRGFRDENPSQASWIDRIGETIPSAWAPPIGMCMCDAEALDEDGP